MNARELEVGQVVQLNPEAVLNKAFAGCFMVVTEPKAFGAVGYVQCVGTREAPGGVACYRAQWSEMEPVAIHAVWFVGEPETKENEK